jgi:hypothetical protein
VGAASGHGRPFEDPKWAGASRLIKRYVSTKYRRQSTEGYAHNGRLIGEVCVNRSKMVIETQD